MNLANNLDLVLNSLLIWRYSLIATLIGTIVVSSSVFLLQRFKRQHLPSTRINLRRFAQKSLCLPELSSSPKAMLVLIHGVDPWLPYMIPLHHHITKLGNDFRAGPPNQDIYLEYLHSQSIDQEHCVIYAEQDSFTIFDRARFNGTLVNQALIPPEGQTLSTGAVITLGPVAYMFVDNQNS